MMKIDKKTAQQMFRSGIAIFSGGAVLVLQHAITYGTFEAKDYSGHEWYGVIGSIIGVILMVIGSYFDVTQNREDGKVTD